MAGDMDTGEAPAADETMTPVGSPGAQQPPASLCIPGAALSAAAEAPVGCVSAAAAAPSGASPSPALAAAAAAAASSSPGALLAASLLRSRATYFERLSSGSRASTSCQQDGAVSASSIHRQSTALAAQPLHPLAPHPLSGSGRTAGGGAGARWRDGEPQLAARRQSDSDSGIDDDDDSVDTFFDKPSYTCYGAAVELSPASSYGGAPRQTPSPPQGGARASTSAGAEPSCSRSNSSSTVAGPPPSGSQSGTAASAPGAEPAGPTDASVPARGSASFVRSMSAHFGRVSSVINGPGGRGAAGLDGLFDDLVTHVGALLASHPDVEAQMGMVQGLSDRLLELHALCETLGRKEDEVEHLRGVLCELTTTRAEAIRLKVQMAESLNGLQQEYYKVLRSAQLAQGTCKQHSARAAATRKQLVEAQSELVRYKRAVMSLRDRNRRLRSENEDMTARLQALEQGRLGADGHRSACYMTLLQAQTPVLY